MAATYSDESADTLTQAIIEGMQEKKAEEITVLDLRNVKNSITDFFVICSGSSDTHVDAISNSIEGIVKKKIKENPWQREGLQNKQWVILDYVSVVAHIFLNEWREHYGLENLWGDAVTTQIEDAGQTILK
jgi:ribosome-associated protein